MGADLWQFGFNNMGVEIDYGGNWNEYTDAWMITPKAGSDSVFELDCPLALCEDLGVLRWAQGHGINSCAEL